MTESPATNPNPENLSSKGKNKTAKPANEVTTEFGVESSGLATQKHAPTPSACERFREAIELGLSRGRNAMAIWQDLVADCSFSGSYQTVKRFVRKLRGNLPAGARAVIAYLAVETEIAPDERFGLIMAAGSVDSNLTTANRASLVVSNSATAHFQPLAT